MLAELVIYPQDLTIFLRIVIIAFLFEAIRIGYGYFFVSQHSQSAKLEKEKIRIQMELSQIKSIQLELVRHSKLERNLIKIDKELEKLKANQIPKEKQMKFHFQIARILLFVVAGFYFSSSSVVLMSPKAFWPFGWIFFTSNETITVHPVFLLLLASAASRHCLRTVLLVFTPASSFP